MPNRTRENVIVLRCVWCDVLLTEAGSCASCVSRKAKRRRARSDREWRVSGHSGIVRASESVRNVGERFTVLAAALRLGVLRFAVLSAM